MPRTSRTLDMQQLSRTSRLATGMLALLCALAAVPRLQAQNVSSSRPQPTLSYVQGAEAKITGYILSRNGDSLLVQDETTDAISLVMVNADTKIESPTGVFTLGDKRQGEEDLIPGLRLELKGTGGMGGELVASKVEFHSSAHHVAEQIAAGTVDLRAFTDSATRATADSLAAVTDRARDTLNALISRARNSVSALNTRIENLDKFDLSQSRTVYFATGRAELLPDGQRTLDDMISASRSQMCGCVFEISGFTDSRGRELMNDRLSWRRAQSVIRYLNDHGVALRDIATPLGYGESEPVATNVSASGRAMNRRVQVRLLVSRAMVNQ